MKLKICLMGWLCLFFQAKSHGQTNSKSLEIGDKMPDAKITNIMNWKHETARLSDFKGKVVILDFWNTYCASCIAGFPKLDSLQRRFGGKLQVLLVNKANEHEKERNIKIVIDRMKAWSDNGFILPVVYHDEVLSGYFDFRAVPFTVMVGPDGTIAAIPDKSEITAENVAKLLAGEKLKFKNRAVSKTPAPRKAAL